MIFNMTGSTGGSTGEPMSSIIVTAPTGSTVTASLGDTVKTAIEDNGTWTFTGCDIGEWTIFAERAGEATVDTVDIAEEGQLMRYYVTLNFFTATINVTYPSGSTCTCTNGAIVIEAPNTSGSTVFTVPEAGNWVISCTDGTDMAEQAVTITEYGQEVHVELTYRLYLF